MHEQLSLLEWRPPAEVIPFPFHRSHGATAGVAREIMHMETPKRTGRLNSLRVQTRKRMEALVGTDRAEQIAEDLIRMIKIQIAYHQEFPFTPPKQITTGIVISAMKVQRPPKLSHCDGAGEAGARGQGTLSLAGVGSAHEQQQVSARARDGGAA